MRKLCLIPVIVVLVAASLSYAEMFDFADIEQGSQSLRAWEKSSGQDLWESTISTQMISHEGQAFLYINEVGAGVYGKDKTHKTWLSEAYYRVKGREVLPDQTRLVYKDQQGKTIQTIEKFYDPKEERVICVVDGKQKKFKFKADLIDKELLGTAVRNYPFAEKRDFIFHLLTNEPTLYKITLEYQTEETLIIDSQLIKCHKLRMIPDLGALSIFGAFVPKTYFWYTAAKPHQFVRYEGLESGLGTPYIVMERNNTANTATGRR
ncbi:hypothetical protein ACFL1W_00065 [Candidatus Margulisiibacteriota bacterium]